uniref:Uncharacterized protein n=1 Tax=Tetraselmis sp. GSL018 TaxID=582737 RepID=A0A061SBQ9_9CHLO
MSTVLRGQWTKIEFEELKKRRQAAAQKAARFISVLSESVTEHAGEQHKSTENKNGGGNQAANSTNEVKQIKSSESQPAGAGRIKSLVKKHAKKMRSITGQSMPNASVVLDDFTPVPELVKLLVTEAFINLRNLQYVRVMGIYWLQRARYIRKRRFYERNRDNPMYKNQSHPLPPKLLPMPRGCRASELQVIMQQGVYETAIMEVEGGWDLSEKRNMSASENTGDKYLSETERQRVPHVQERLRKRLFMCNISLKAGLTTSWTVGT